MAIRQTESVFYALLNEVRINSFYVLDVSRLRSGLHRFVFKPLIRTYEVGSSLRTVSENAPRGKKPLGRPRLKWDDGIKEAVVKVRPGTGRKELSSNREIWRRICWTTWS